MGFALAALALTLALPAAALATRSTAAIDAAFRPERLGHPTALSFAFTVTPADGPPSPLRALSIDYPANLGIATSGLGLASCTPLTLEVDGPGSCPPDALLGHGTALVEIPIGRTLVEENVALTLLAGPSPDGYLHLLVYASGETPVIAQEIIPGVLDPGRLELDIPPIPSLPEAPYVSVARMRLTLGGALTYYQPVHGALRAYRPAGISLPASCPRPGFAFAARFGFMDGSRSQAAMRVPCPPRRHHG